MPSVSTPRARAAFPAVLSLITFLWAALVLLAALAALMGRAYADPDAPHDVAALGGPADPTPDDRPVVPAAVGVAARVAGPPLNLLVPGMETPARDLLGWPVFGPGLERLGAVESVFAEADGSVAGVVLWLRPTATATARSVAVARRDFVIQIGKVAMGAGGDTLRERPAFAYANPGARGAVLAPAILAAALESKGPPGMMVAGVPVAEEKPAEYSSGALMGAPVLNLADEALGRVADLVMDQNGRLQAVLVVPAGGPENRPVRLEDSEIRVIREEGGLTVRTSLPRPIVEARHLQQQALVR